MLRTDDTSLLPGIRMLLGNGFMVEISLPDKDEFRTPQDPGERERSIAVTIRDDTPYASRQVYALYNTKGPSEALRGLSSLLLKAASRIDKTFEEKKS